MAEMLSTVLLVSDDPETRESVVSTLGEAGYTVKQAHPEEARACSLERPVGSHSPRPLPAQGRVWSWRGS